MYKSDLQIAQECKMQKITEVAAKLGLGEDDIELYGKYKAKINPSAQKAMNAKIILVTAINPTPAGEGKSTTTVGLADALSAIGKKTVVALREPSFGPVLGIKGGAAGGGYAQAVPMEDLNLHFTGDMHAITTANNTISAMIDNHIHQGNELNIDPTRIVWKRCLDMNDRALRQVVVGLGGHANGKAREDGFDITVASEVMAMFTLATDMNDLKKRLDRTVIAYTNDNKPVTLKDLGATGACALILSEALKPNLIQTLEHTPVIVHGGPFANIAHGCNSIIATNMARGLGDYVVTEAGFGADLGAEKFLDIKARVAGFKPNAVVIVATIRALKMHGGVAKTDLKNENVEALLKGVENLEKHIENIKKYNLPYVVAINKFVTDTDNEVKSLMDWCTKNGHEMSLSEVWEFGGKGAIDLANKVVKVIDANPNPDFKFIYDLNDSIETKIEKICKEIYGADGVDFSSAAKAKIKTFNENGWDKLPICMAKTQYSLSDDQNKKGRPRNFRITVRDMKPSIGAGFLVCLTGDIMTMPGLPKHPAALDMDVLEDGKAVGLF